MISGYIFSIVLATLPLVGISNYSSTSICLPMKAEDPLDMIYLLTLLAASSIGFTIMVVCYLHIYFHLHMVDVAHGCVFNRETAATKKMALLVSWFNTQWAVFDLENLSRCLQTLHALPRLHFLDSQHSPVTVSLTSRTGNSCSSSSTPSTRAPIRISMRFSPSNLDERRWTWARNADVLDSSKRRKFAYGKLQTQIACRRMSAFTVVRRRRVRSARGNLLNWNCKRLYWT